MTGSSGRIVRGPAFIPLIKIGASILVGALFFYVFNRLTTLGWEHIDSVTLGLYALATAMCAWVGYWIVFGITTVTDTYIEQTWLWKKRVELSQVTYAKLIYLPYLSWLIAPRLVLKTGLSVYVFHGATRELVEAFAAITLGPLAKQSPAQE